MAPPRARFVVARLVGLNGRKSLCDWPIGRRSIWVMSIIATRFGFVAIVVFFWMNLLDTFLTGISLERPAPVKGRM